MELSTNLDGVPHTDANARIETYKNVEDVLAICVEDASYRLASLSGWFEVADVSNPFRYVDGSLKVEVKCGWKGAKPPTEWLHLAIGNKYQLVRRYTGKVAANIS